MLPPSQPYTQDLAATATTGQAETGINAAFTYCWTHGLIARNPNNTQPDRIHTSATCFNRAQGHQMSSTLTNMLGGNATVYQAPRNTNRGGRDGGRRNGRHRGGRDGGRGTGRRGGRRQNAQPVAAEPTAAVAPPQQYAQAMVMPPPLLLVRVCYHQWLLLQWVIPTLIPTPIALLVSETHGVQKIVLYNN